MPCTKAVVNVKCQYCKKETIKFGIRGSIQRYRCKECLKIQLAVYRKNACEAYNKWKKNSVVQKNSIVYYLSAGAFAAKCPSTGHENATSFGLCAAFSRLNGSYYFNKYS